MFSYRQILKTSLKISWKNKYLWVFGIFASFLSIGAEYQILWRALSRQATLDWYNGWNMYMQTGIFSGAVWGNIVHLFKTNPGIMTMILFFSLIILAIIFVSIWLAVTAQIALVINTEKIIKSKKDEIAVADRSNLAAGAPSFWPVFGLNLFSKIIINVLVILITLPLLFLAVNHLLLNVLYLIFFVILIPVAIAVSLLIKYAIAYVALKKQTIFMSLKKAWELFKENWIISLEMALLLFVISFLATLAILIASAIIAVPFIILATSFFHLFSMAAFWVMVSLALIVITIFIILAGAFLSAFQVVVWTNLFMQLVSKGGESKLERILPEGIKNINVIPVA